MEKREKPTSIKLILHRIGIPLPACVIRAEPLHEEIHRIPI